MDVFLEYQHGRHHVKLRLPAGKLQEGLRIVSELSAASQPAKPGKAPEELETDPEMLWWYQRHCSPMLCKSEEFQKLLPELKDTPQLVRTNILPIKTIVEDRKGKLVGRREPDWKEWQEDLPKTLKGINPESMERAVIHVSGNIPGEAKRRIAETLTHQLPDIPVNVILTERKGKWAVIELILCGFDIKDNVSDKEDE